jgi:5-methylcytosine-specific restriction endonuclease McrA
VLQADHIKPFAHHPELRFDVNNGRTLCVPCHRKTDTYGGRSRAKVCVAVDATGY